MKTNESRCLLAVTCQHAGDPTRCHDLCWPWRKLYGQSGSGGLYGETGIDAEYRYVTSATLPFAEQNPKVYRFVRRFCENVAEYVDEKGYSAYFYSKPSPGNKLGTGTGKTTAACAIANEYLIHRLRQHFNRERMLVTTPVLFVNVARLQNTYNAMFRQNETLAQEASDLFYSLKERAMTVDLLILDDIGVRDGGNTFVSELYEIIDERVSNSRSTIYTSNLPIEELANIFDPRIVSRIRANCAEVPFSGPDMRDWRNKRKFEVNKQAT